MPEPAVYPELIPELRERSLWKTLGFFGPGAIIACVTIGSGETVFASRGGAIFGYAMLWCFMAGAICKGMLVYSGSRFITLTGRSPLQSWMELPGPRGWFVWFVAVMTIIWMPFWLAGLPGMLGNFSNWVVGIQNPEAVAGFSELPKAVREAQSAQYATYGRYWGTFYILVALIITWVQSYGFLEKLQTAIVALLLVCMVVAAVATHPDWSLMFSGLFIPRVPEYEPWVHEVDPTMVKYSPWIEVMVYLGVIGGGAQDYFGYVGMLREKAWGMLGWTDRSQAGPPPEISAEPENVARGKKWLLPAQVDMSLSVVAILIFTGAFVVLGATVLHPNHVIPDGFTLLTEQAAFLTHLVGEQGGVRLVVDWLYRTGIFFAFFGTILGAYEIFVRTVREAVIAIWPTTEGVPLTKFRAWVLLYVGGGGLAILWTGVDPRLIVVPAALVGSGLICGLWCFAMLWSDRAHLPRPLRMPMLLKVALFLSGAVLTVGPSIGIWKYSQDMLIPYLRGDAIVPEGSELELLFTRTLDIEGGLTEGPAAAPDGSIYFTDITPGDSGGKIMRFNPATGETSVFVEDSRKANGLAFDNQGRLVACEGADFGGRCISRYDLATGEREVLVDRYEGKRLNAPNDLCIDSKGRIYFTDPKYVGPEERELDQFAVYRLNPDKTLALVTDNIEKPNGVALSPDERTLYVADTNNGTDQIEASEPANPPQLGAMKVYAFALDRQGHPKGQRKTLVDFKPEQGCDGMTVDSEGRIYLSVRSLARPGVLVIDSNGKEVAFISTGPAKQQTAASPQGIPSNVEFGVGDDANVLYITIDQGLQRIRLNSHRAQANVSAN